MVEGSLEVEAEKEALMLTLSLVTMLNIKVTTATRTTTNGEPKNAIAVAREKLTEIRICLPPAFNTMRKVIGIHPRCFLTDTTPAQTTSGLTNQRQGCGRVVAMAPPEPLAILVVTRTVLYTVVVEVGTSETMALEETATIDPTFISNTDGAVRNHSPSDKEQAVTIVISIRQEGALTIGRWNGSSRSSSKKLPRTEETLNLR